MRPWISKLILFFLVVLITLFESTATLARAHSLPQIAQNSKPIIVAIIDTGMDPNHPQLSPFVWRPLDDLSFFGWDFSRHTGQPYDDNGHGTHIAGIIQQQISDLASAAQRIVLLPIKYYAKSNSGRENLNNTVQAIYYAIQHGARIINYSAGGSEYSAEEFAAIKSAESQGVLFVSAVGNDGKDLDQRENNFYPSKYSASNILTVAAIDETNHLMRSSNYGKHHADIAAPGHDIFSSLPGGRYGKMSGTSQATAFVTGVAARLLAENPSLTYADLKRIVKKSAIPIPELTETIACGGRAHLANALALLEIEKSTQSTPLKRLVLEDGPKRWTVRDKASSVPNERNRVLSQLSRLNSK